MELNLEQIKAAAMAANPGPWHWVNPENDQPRRPGEWRASLRSVEKFVRYPTSMGRRLPYFIVEADEICDTDGKMDANAEFIAAANPSAVLALIERLERAERERDSYKRALLSAPPMPAGVLCKGSMALGSGCGLCERCRKEMEGAK